MGTLQSILSVGTKAEETKPSGLNDAASMTVARAAKTKRNDNQQVVCQQPSRKSKTTLVPLKKTTTTKMQLRTSKKREIATLTKKAKQPPKKRQKKAKAPTRKEDSGKKKEAAAINASESSMSEPHEQEQEDAEDEDPVPGDHKRCPLCNKVFHNKGISRHLVWCQEQQQQEQAAAQSEEDDAAAGNVDSGHSAATNNNIAASNAGVTTRSKSKSIAGGSGGDDDDDGDGDADDHSGGNGGGRGGGGKKDDKDEDDDDDEDEEGSENEDEESENEDDERSKKLALLKCFAEGLAENAKARKSGTASASMIQAKEWLNKLPGPVVEKITAMTNAILINAAASRRTNTNDSKAVESWGSISSITSILPKKSKCRGLPNTNRHKREIDRNAKSGLLKRIKKIDKMGNVISIDIDSNDSWNPKPWEEASFSQASDPPIWSFVEDVIYEISQMKEDGYDNNDDRPWLCGYYHLLEGGYDNRPWLRCYHLENNGVGDAICKTLMVLPSNDNNETVSDSVNFFLKLGWYTNHYGLMKPLYTFVDVDNKICTVSFPIDDDVKAKDIVLDLDKNNLRIGIKTGNDDDDNGVLFFIKDEVLLKCVLEDDSSYEIGDIGGQRSIVLELSKKDVGPWECLLQSDAVKSCMGRLVDKVCKRAEDDATKSVASKKPASKPAPKPPIVHTSTATVNNTLDNNSLADSEDTESDSDDTAEWLRRLVAARKRLLQEPEQKQDIAYKDDEGEDNTTIVDAAAVLVTANNITGVATDDTEQGSVCSNVNAAAATTAAAPAAAPAPAPAPTTATATTTTTAAAAIDTAEDCRDAENAPPPADTVVCSNIITSKVVPEREVVEKAGTETEATAEANAEANAEVEAEKDIEEEEEEDFPVNDDTEEETRIDNDTVSTETVIHGVNNEAHVTEEQAADALLLLEVRSERRDGGGGTISDNSRNNNAQDGNGSGSNSGREEQERPSKRKKKNKLLTPQVYYDAVEVFKSFDPPISVTGFLQSNKSGDLLNENYQAQFGRYIKDYNDGKLAHLARPPPLPPPLPPPPLPPPSAAAARAAVSDMAALVDARTRLLEEHSRYSLSHYAARETQQQNHYMRMANIAWANYRQLDEHINNLRN